jgi:hypothetical protein
VLKSSFAALAIVLGMSLSACGGGGGPTTVQNTTVSKGQQLMDLKEALDKGAITQDEYDAQRKKILNGKN